MLEKFADPPREYCPVPFWFLNDKLEKERLQWQVAEMHDKHVYGAIMHPRPGLVTKYLSEDWFDNIGHTIRKAAELSMFMWLYDEYPWMSGMAEWRVPRMHDDFRIRALDHVERSVSGPVTLTWDVEKELPENAGRVVAVLRSPIYPSATPGPAEIVATAWQSARNSNPQAGCPDALEVAIPSGDHLVGVYFERYSYNCYGDKFGVDEVTDLMNPAAVDAFIRLTHVEYEKRFAEFLGPVVTAVFTDEPPSDTPGWSRVLLDEFRIRKGYDLTPHLMSLFHVPESTSDPRFAGALDRVCGQARFDYGDVVSELYEENFLGKLEAWADRCGIASTGHLLLEETLLFHARYMGDFFRSQRRLHYPGIDYIFPGEIPAITCKMAASVAHLYGKERVISECFALTGWDFSPEHMKWMTDWQVVNGVDYIVPHAFFYSISESEPIPPMELNLGFRWFDCPPSMFYQQPYWDYYAHYADYVRRLCYLITRGDHQCSIALYYPIESVQAEFIPDVEYCDLHTFKLPGTWMTPSYRWDGVSMEQTDTHLRAAGNLLRDRGLDFDVVDDDSVRDGSSENGVLSLRGSRTYGAIVLPRTRWIAVDVYQKIAEFHQNGGIVVATGDVPQFACDGPSHDYHIQDLTKRIFGIAATNAQAMGTASQSASGGRSAIFSRPDEDFVSFLDSAELRDFESSDSGVYCQHRRVDSAELYFISHHERTKSVRTRIRLRGDGSPRILNPESGSVSEPQGWSRDGALIQFNVTLEPNDAFFVLIDDDERLPESMGPRLDADKLELVSELTTDWTLSLDAGDRHPMRTCDMPQNPDFADLEVTRVLSSLSPWEELDLASFSGGGTYDTTFGWNQEIDGSTLYVDLGTVGVAAEVQLNEVSCGVRLWPPYRYDVTDSIKQGHNTIRIRVTNTLANSIQETYGTGAVPTSATDEQRDRFARFKEGRLRSGLCGPVTIFRVAD